MQAGKYYRIKYDRPVQDLTVKCITDKHNNTTFGSFEVVEVHGHSDYYNVGETFSMAVQFLDSFEEVEKPVEPVVDGKYLTNLNEYVRHDGVWYSKADDFYDYDAGVRNGSIWKVNEDD